jgi:hypothetical protein
MRNYIREVHTVLKRQLKFSIFIKLKILLSVNGLYENVIKAPYTLFQLIRGKLQVSKLRRNKTSRDFRFEDVKKFAIILQTIILEIILLEV